MPVFEYKGKTLAGAVVKGSLKAKSRSDLERVLRQNRILVSSITKKAPEINIKIGTGIKRIEVSRFTRQFATMIGAGLPMVQCLEILGKQTEKEFFKTAILRVMTDVEGGSTLGEALARHPKIFTKLFVHMVEAGEAGGILDIILNRLAVYLEKADALQRKIKSAMTYPAVVCFVAVGASVFMLMFIIPTFAKMFTDFGGDLPLPTKIVMGISDFLRDYWYLLAGGIGALAFAFQRYYKTDGGRRVVDRTLLRIPVLGTVIRKGAVARFTRTLGTLISSGVPILNGLEITGRTAGNKIIEEAVMATRDSISQGNTIADPLKASGVFPPMVTQMIGVGEQTGALDEMLEKIANFYDDEVDTAVDSLTAIIEPAMIVLMGGLVGGMLIAMYLPMFKLISVVSGG